MPAKFSVKKPYTVIVAIILVIALGVISFMNMTTDLLPSMDLPYVIVYTVNTGSTPEAIEADITRPLEASFSTLTDIKNVNSTSSENLSLVVLEFVSGADMNTAMIEISSHVDQVSGSWDDSVSSPVIMKLNPDMLPVTIASVSLSDADLLTLSDYVEDELVPAFESVNGVASVTASGVMTQQVDITIEQSRIDVVNSAVLRDVDSKLADTEDKLRDAKRKINSGKGMLNSMRVSTLAQIDEALSAIDQGTKSLPLAIAMLTSQREGLAPQLEAAKSARDQLETLVNMPDEDKAALTQIVAQVEELKKQRAELAKQLENTEVSTNDTTQSQIDALKTERAAVAAQREREQEYVRSLQVLDADDLKATIKNLTESIKKDEAELNDVYQQRETAIAERDQLKRDLDELELQIAALQPQATVAPTATPADDPTNEPADAPTAAAEPAVDPATKSTDAPAASKEAPADNNNSDQTPAPAEAAVQSAPEETVVNDPAPASDSEGVTTAPEPAANTESATEAPKQEEPKQETPATEAPRQEEPQQEVPAPEAPTQEPKQEEPKQEAPAPVQEAPAPAPETPIESKQAEPAPVQEEPAVTETQIAWNISLSPVAHAEQTLTLEELILLRDQVQKSYDDSCTKVEALIEHHDALRENLTQEQASLDSAKEALDLFDEGETAVQTKIDEANARIAGYDAQLAAYDAQLEALSAQLQAGNAADALNAQIIMLDAQISAIEESDAYKAALLVSNKKELKNQYEQAQSAVTQLETAIATMDANLEKLNNGILPAGFAEGITEDTNLKDSRDQLKSAREQALAGFSKAASALSEASSKIAEAWKEFEDKRDEALENAGIDGIVTVQTISQILGAQNLDMPAGYVSDPDGKYLVSVGTEFASISELKEVKLFSLGLDTIDDVRLMDVASVSISDNSEDLFTLLNGSNGIMLSFEKQSTASTAEVAKLITAESEKLMEANPNLEIIELMNQGDYIDLIVDSVLQNLLYGGALAILVLLLFLMDWRPTLIVAISIPVSVVVAFVGMYFCHITLNVMSLSGLALGVGMLVDNSIVSIENIYRLRNEEHLPVLTACVRGVEQVGGALVASTLTTVCIFLPIVFITGTAHDLFADMGLTFAFSLLASLLVAVTVVPSFSAALFRRSAMKQHKIFDKIQNGYVAILRGALHVKWLVLLLAAGMFAYTVMQVPKMPMSLMPAVNSSQMQATLSFSNESELKDEEKQRLAAEIMNEMLTVDGITDVGLSSGSSMSMLSSMRGGGDSYSYYMLVEEGTRENADIAAEIRTKAANWADGEEVVLEVKESTMDMSAMAGSGITINIYGEEIETMRKAAVEIANICRTVEGAINIDDGSSKAEPKLVITVDKELASDYNLTVAQVYQYIAQRLYGKVKLTEATLDGREYTLYVHTDKDIDLKPEDLMVMEMEVKKTDKTEHILIGDIARITDGTSLQSISRANQKRRVAVSFELDEGYSANLVSRDLEARLAEYTPPTGCRIDLAGENEQLMEYMVDLIEMLAIAILFIFLIMVAQFQSFKSPIIIMFTIPLALTGGLLALQLTNMDLSIISMVGFLMLSGVVVNNGIVFIDTVNQMRIAGTSKRDALIETGRIRLRPILMSVLTTVLGMLTMGLGTGMGAEMMQPMAVVTIGGLVYSTLLTLFVVPSLYDIFNGQQMKAREIEMAKEAAGLTREGFENL